ncbi:MAG: hypothetical protein E7615_02190 [Ruminococcaceae bacterium]|nr:hypothetical protein [Oscillospiraceae bacterium]
MQKNTKTAKLNIPMCIAAILFCLTLFSFHLCGGLYARYTVSGSGYDDARVARFDVSDEGAFFSENLLIETVPGTFKRSIHVTNNSEVTVAYTVTIKNTTQNIPYTFSINNSTPIKDECTVICYLPPNSHRTVNLLANWDAEGALEYMGMVDLIKLTVHAQQVD